MKVIANTASKWQRYSGYTTIPCCNEASYALLGTHYSYKAETIRYLFNDKGEHITAIVLSQPDTSLPTFINKFVKPDTPGGY